MQPLLLLCLIVGVSGALPLLLERRCIPAFFVFAALTGAGALLLGIRPTLAVDSTWLWVLALTAALASSVPSLIFRDDPRPVAFAGFGVLVVSIGWFIGGTAIFRAEEYRKLAEVSERVYDGKVELLAQERVQLVDEQRARIRAGELLGADKGLGSQFGVGDFNLIVASGRATWIAPLVNRRLGPWIMGDASPGYVSVDATDDRIARVMTDRPIRVHGPGESFLNSVDRLLWFSGFADQFTTDFSLEIDDTGRPFWVISTYEPTIGLSGNKVTGVFIVDAETGDIEHKGVEKAPSWVDLIYPAWIVEENLEANGLYVGGWWNGTFVGEGVVVPTGTGMTIVHMADGSSRFYTGLATQTSQNGGTSGFALADTRTGKVDAYLAQGISEMTAKGVLEGVYQAEGYKATFPRLYLVDGKPTLVSLLTDKGGNPKAVGMVAQETRAVFGAGQTLEEARRDYVAKWNTQRSAGSLGDKTSKSEATFQVARIGFEITANGTSAILAAYIGPDNGKVRTFVVPVAQWRDAGVTREGDTVRIQFIETDSLDAVALEFENVSAFPARE